MKMAPFLILALLISGCVATRQKGIPLADLSNLHAGITRAAGSVTSAQKSVSSASAGVSRARINAALIDAKSSVILENLP